MPRVCHISGWKLYEKIKQRQIAPVETKIQIGWSDIDTWISQSRVITRVQRKKTGSTEMRFLRKIEGKTVMYRFRNEVYTANLNVSISVLFVTLLIIKFTICSWYQIKNCCCYCVVFKGRILLFFKRKHFYRVILYCIRILLCL